MWRLSCGIKPGSGWHPGSSVYFLGDLGQVTQSLKPSASSLGRTLASTLQDLWEDGIHIVEVKHLRQDLTLNKRWEWVEDADNSWEPGWSVREQFGYDTHALNLLLLDGRIRGSIFLSCSLDLLGDTCSALSASLATSQRIPPSGFLPTHKMLQVKGMDYLH